MRAFWKGNISFGLINIPVSLHVATESHELSFKLLHEKDLSEIRYARICKDEDKEIPYNEIVKGYEEKGRYAVLSDEDFAAAEQEKSRTIDISVFVDESDVDTIYYEKPYYLTPDKQGAKAYALLHHALLKAGKVAVAQYTFKNHIHVGVIKPHEHVLVLNQMRFQSQLRSLKDLGVSESTRVTKVEMDMALKLIDQLAGAFKPKTYKDTYVEDLKEIIRKKKARGHKPAPKKKPARAEKAKVYDLMALLKKSLEEKGERKTVRKKRA